MHSKKSILKITAIILATTLLYSCFNNSKEKNVDTLTLDTLIKASDTAIAETKPASAVSTEKVDIDFCADCKNLDTWIGGIQGVEISDSTKVYPFGECHTNLSYDLIWVPKGDILKFNKEMGHDRLLVYYEEESFNNKYSKLDCFSFVIPKKKKKPTAKDNSPFSYVFPSEVKVYKRTDNVWALIGAKNVKSFEELGRLKLNSIFNKAL
jgi:hypothetical protein